MFLWRNTTKTKIILLCGVTIKTEKMFYGVTQVNVNNITLWCNN